MADKKVFRQDLTNKIIELIEKGTAPWMKPWDAQSLLKLRPYNAATNRPYSGGNAYQLIMAGQCLSNGGLDPRWATYKQCQQQGWNVKKGSSGTLVEYWKWPDKETESAKKSTYPEDRPIVFYAVVFHASQIEGIPDIEIPKLEWEPQDLAEAILINSKANLQHDQAYRAYYAPLLDEIHLPSKTAFPNSTAYYQTALHELAHWSGHKDRLDRDLSCKFGSDIYAMEELRAEMGSLFMCMETGVPFAPAHLENVAAYQKLWIKNLKDDKNEIFKAAREGEKIADYLCSEITKEITIELEKSR